MKWRCTCCGRELDTVYKYNIEQYLGDVMLCPDCADYSERQYGTARGYRQEYDAYLAYSQDLDL